MGIDDKHRSRTGPELRFDDPCVVFALRRERQPFCREFRPHQRFADAPCWAGFCGPPWLPILAIETGVGQVRTEQALHWLLGGPLFGNVPYRPKVVLATGFCGALHRDFHTGDLILATEVIDAASGLRWPTTWPGELPTGPWNPPLHRGRMVTAPQLVAIPEQKRVLASQFDAVAVDMESAAVARLCHEAAVPFGCLRVVVDDVDTPLSPRLVSLLSSGRASPMRLAAALLTSPGLAAELCRLAKSSRLAAAALAKGLGEVLTLTLPWMAPNPDERTGLSPPKSDYPKKPAQNELVSG